MTQRKVVSFWAIMLGLLWIGSPLTVVKAFAADDASTVVADAKQDADTTAKDAKKKAKKAKKKAKAKKDEAVTEAQSSETQAVEKTEKKTKRSKKKAKETAADVESNAATTAAGASAAVGTAANSATNTAAPVAEKAADSAKSSGNNWLNNLGKKKDSASSAVSTTHRVDGKLDLNTATSDELQAAGLSSTAAQKVIAGRPFTRKDELKKQGILTDSDYEKVKENLIAHTAKN